MIESEGKTDATPSEGIGGGGQHNPRSLANLRPAWRSGQSGNPSGLTKDGRPPKVAKLEASLLDELERSGGMQALAKRWVMLAKKGNSTALSAILERLYPVPQEDKQAGRVVLEGLRLELTHTGGAQVTVMRQEGLPAGSDARSDAPESRDGGARHRDPGQQTLSSGGTQGILSPPHPYKFGPIEAPLLGTHKYHEVDASSSGVSGEAVRGVQGGPTASPGEVLPGLPQPEQPGDGDASAGGAEGASRSA